MDTLTYKTMEHHHVLMGKSMISMAMFNSCFYCLPEGNMGTSTGSPERPIMWQTQ
jgi:hypothetical protein